MVSILASLLVILGLGALLLGGITFLIAAFRTSILWGLGVLFIGPLSLVYLFFHWNEAKKPFFIQLWGIGFILVAQLATQGNLPWPFQ
jgi:hypothetical protein